MRIVSWNVNSLRSAEFNFLKFIQEFKPDILMIQELRATPSQLSFFLQFVDGYKTLFNPSGRPGYAGTALYYKSTLQLVDINTTKENTQLGEEGRCIYFRIGNTYIFNYYIPNGGSGPERLNYKLNYCIQVNEFTESLIKSGYNVIIGGDLNVAHKPIDLFNPKANIFTSGFLPQERSWLDALLSIGLFDSFRAFNQNPENYTWWNLGDPTRAKNKGWRFDYFLVSNNLKSELVSAQILKNVFGSDHCPVSVDINID